MPIYEYRCRACGQAFEKLVYGQGPQAAIACPGCASPEVTRTLSVFGVKTGTAVMTTSGATGGGCCGGGCGCR